jgi:hypothetical protein
VRLPRGYLDVGRARPTDPGVRGNLNANVQSLDRLAQLLQRRYRRAAGRSFVLLMAELPRGRRFNTDDIETQPIPVLQLA